MINDNRCNTPCATIETTMKQNPSDIRQHDTKGNKTGRFRTKCYKTKYETAEKEIRRLHSVAQNLEQALNSALISPHSDGGEKENNDVSKKKTKKNQNEELPGTRFWPGTNPFKEAFRSEMYLRASILDLFS